MYNYLWYFGYLYIILYIIHVFFSKYLFRFHLYVNEDYYIKSLWVTYVSILYIGFLFLFPTLELFIITCLFSLADKLTKLSITKTVLEAFNNVTLTVAAPAASSAIKIDLTIALELAGTVYKVVAPELVKLVFLFVYTLATYKPRESLLLLFYLV